MKKLNKLLTMHTIWRSYFKICLPKQETRSAERMSRRQQRGDPTQEMHKRSPQEYKGDLGLTAGEVNQSKLWAVKNSHCQWSPNPKTRRSRCAGPRFFCLAFSDQGLLRFLLFSAAWISRRRSFCSTAVGIFLRAGGGSQGTEKQENAQQPKPPDHIPAEQ